MKNLLQLLFLLPCLAMAQPDSTARNPIDSFPQLKLKDDVLITATRAGENTPFTYVNIQRKELQQNNLGQDLPFLLDQTPSIVTTSDAGAGIGYTGLRIRGSDATRVNVTLNGIPVNDAESQGVFWVNTPDLVSSLSSVQIQRGIGASTNGSSAFGGQLSMQTNTIQPKPFVEAGASLGSFSTFRGNVRAGSGLIKDRFFVEASGSWINSRGYIERGSSNLRSWFAQAGYSSQNTLIKLVYFGGREKTYQAWYGVPQDSLATNRRMNWAGTDFFQQYPPYRNETDNYGQDYIQLHAAQRINNHWQLNAALFTTLGRGYYEQFKKDASVRRYFEELPANRTDLVRQRWLSNVFYGGTWNLTYTRQKFDFTLGGLAAQYRGKHFGKVVWTAKPLGIDPNRHYYEGNSTKEDINTYARFNYAPLRGLNLYADVQYRFVQYQTKGEDNDQRLYNIAERWHFVNPKAGVSYTHRQQHQWYAGYAFGNREPNRDDLLDALAGFKPTPERMHNAELGYKWLHPMFPLQLNYYMMYYDNQLVLTGRLNDVGNPVKTNVPVSYRTGVELNGSIRIKTKQLLPGNTGGASWLLRDAQQPLFVIHYAFTYALNRIRSFTETIYTYDEDYSPIDSLTLQIEHRNTDIAFSPSVIASLEFSVYPIRGLELSLQNKFVGRQFMDNTSNTNRMLKPFYYSNLRIAYQLPLNDDKREIRFTLLLNNLYSKLFESNGYTFSERYAFTDDTGTLQTTDVFTYNYLYPQAPFNFLAGIQVRF